SAVLTASEDAPVVRFAGTVSTPNAGAVLDPFVDAVHAVVARCGAKVVTVDFSAFEFCNSTGFKSFIHWIERIRQLPAESRYRLRFLVAPGRRWQRTSLLALTCCHRAVEVSA
ncbi:MAG TPA: hypothetical protein VF400_07400, partial [Anaeromyxobacteraceae bacterium]